MFNERNFEILKLTLELICSGWSARRCIADGRDFVKALYDLGAIPHSRSRDNHRRRRAANRRPALKPAVNGNLALVARMASGLKPCRQNESQRAAADRIVAAQYDGRLPDRPSDLTRKGITTISGSWPNTPSSCRANGFSGLFSDYWLTTLLLTVADDFRHAAAENSRKGVGAPPGADRHCRRQAVLPFPALALPRPGAVFRPARRCDSKFSTCFSNLSPEITLRLYRGVAGSRRAAAGRRPHYLGACCSSTMSTT